MSMANSQPSFYGGMSDLRSLSPRAVTLCAFALLHFLLLKSLGGSEQLWGLCRGETCITSLSQAPGHGLWQGEAVSWKLIRLVGPTEHLFAWAGEFSLQPWLVGVLCGIQDGWNMA